MIQGHQVVDGSITVCTAVGRLTYPEIRSKVIDLSTSGVTPRMLCDLTQATVADLSSKEIEEIIKLVSSYMTGAREGRVAIIANGGVDYGLARMFSTFAELAGLPVKVRVFRMIEIAKEWLRDPVPA